MKIKLLSYEMTQNSKINIERGMNSESKYNYQKINERDFFYDMKIEFKVPFVEIGKDSDEYSIATLEYLIADVPSDDENAHKKALQVAMNEMKNILEVLMTQMLKNRTIKIENHKKKDIDFFSKTFGTQDNKTEESHETEDSYENDSFEFDDKDSFGGLN